MTSESSGEIVVVGGGVVGLTTALVLAERGASVRVWTRDGVEATTSAVAGALWWPYRIEPVAAARAWALRSLEVYEDLAARAAPAGVRMAEGVLGETDLDEADGWLAGRVPGLRASTADEYAGTGVRARLPLIDMPAHLPWLRERFVAAGGVVETRTVSSFAEVDAPVVVNCAGLAARELVPDPSVRPVRGQLVVVENPGIDTWLVTTDAAGEHAYLFPQPGGLVLGGTSEEDAWSLEPDPATAEAIIRRCAALRPEITGARVLGHRVGLRPTRPAVRLERDALPDGRLLVHNYGHGGAGVTVAWGCAEEAARLVSG
ncbi:D-amino-acid:oxygen oxidoreductase [Streptomyces sp. Ag82_O1-12]|uniref:NAD(P)/FAD-dependent oxidoreductase n=1 Tax=unclassified Streptomyces TaxID=2593676 RepID=UPI000BC8DEB9|nr:MULTISPECIES: FAD-dependent oxidoreductase [unclassified Streptomyces]SMQ20473.1 D-amino-acid:oxygen oxidoreductase [Streptomyces sp. Ag82_O1-12]SOD49312.1 D-amino-acid:oxygen oxidoreductase [Streptomyces sp. Ag82_G6-1]